MKTGCNVDLEFGPEIGQTGNSVACGDGNSSKREISQFYLFPHFTQPKTQSKLTFSGRKKRESNFLSWPFLNIPVAFYDIMAFETDKYHLIQR